MNYPHFWQHWDWRSILLWPISLLFRLVITLRRFVWTSGMWRAVALPVHVVVVGNITVGGTGKTPLVLWLVKTLQALGLQPAIISRGYGSTRRDSRPVTPSDTPNSVGDEPYLIAQRCGCPVWVGVNRVASVLALHAAHPEVSVVISDDGLQHYALARCFEIAVIDGTRGLGNTCLLPAGPLREPAYRLASVDAVVINGEQGVDFQYPNAFRMTLAGALFQNIVDPSQVVSAEHFYGQPLHAVAGIGNPERFFSHINNLGLSCTTHPLPDHHPFQAGDLDFAGHDPVVMTEKDAVKWAPFASTAHWVLVVDATLDAQLGELINARLLTLAHTLDHTQAHIKDHAAT